MLIIETGELVPDANSFVGLDEADAYCVPRGLWEPTGIEVDTEAGTETPDAALVAAKEAALIRAFDWLNTLDWLGQPLDWQQAAAWPRKGVIVPGADQSATQVEYLPENMIPKAVCLAQIEMAALIHGGLDPMAPLARGGKVTSESHSKKEGSLDVIGGESQADSYTYSETAPTETWYPAVLARLAPWLANVPGKTGGTGVREAGRG